MIIDELTDPLGHVPNRDVAVNASGPENQTVETDP